MTEPAQCSPTGAPLNSEHVIFSLRPSWPPVFFFWAEGTIIQPVSPGQPQQGSPLSATAGVTLASSLLSVPNPIMDGWPNSAGCSGVSLPLHPHCLPSGPTIAVMILHVSSPLIHFQGCQSPEMEVHSCHPSAQNSSMAPHPKIKSQLATQHMKASSLIHAPSILSGSWFPKHDGLSCASS